MLFAKERATSMDTQAPTSVYLNAETMTDAVNVSMMLNERLFSNPTNLHLNRMWRIRYHNNIHMLFATPNNILHSTDTRPYIRQLLKYQTVSNIIRPKDYSDYKYRKLYAKYKAEIGKLNEALPEEQRISFINILQNLAANPNISINDLKIQISADRELAVYKKEESGTHYIVVGESLSDISYLFLSDMPGHYFSLHLSEGASLDQIVGTFAA